MDHKSVPVNSWIPTRKLCGFTKGIVVRKAFDDGGTDYKSPSRRGLRSTVMRKESF